MNLSAAECFVLCTESFKQVTYTEVLDLSDTYRCTYVLFPGSQGYFFFISCVLCLVCPSLAIYLVQLEGSYY